MPNVTSSRLKVPVGSSVELSSDGYDFLTFVFDKYDQDKDKALSPQELVNLFSTCPVMPWGPDVYNTVPICDKGWLNLQRYLGLWTLTTLLDTQKTLEYLAYLGYNYHSGEDNQVSALQITRDKKIDLAKKQTSRNVYRCHVIGPKGAGKTTFCQGILGRSRQVCNFTKKIIFAIYRNYSPSKLSSLRINDHGFALGGGCSYIG